MAEDEQTRVESEVRDEWGATEVHHQNMALPSSNTASFFLSSGVKKGQVGSN